jgi:xanthine dehydrogenase YagS FAD-binding subunit
MKPFEHMTAATQEQVLSELSHNATRTYREAVVRPIAGGTDLLPLLKVRLASVDRLVDIKRVTDLRGIRAGADSGLRVGALTTLSDLERAAELHGGYAILRDAARAAATPQLRSAATVAGNLLQRNRCWYFRSDVRCWLKGGEECFARQGRNDHHAILGVGDAPCIAVHPSDLAPTLIALDAEVLIASSRGERTVHVADLLHAPTAEARIEHALAPDELIVELRLPAQPQAAGGAYEKGMERQAWSFALASAAAVVQLGDGRVEHARLVLGGVAPVPWRDTEAEALLVGQTLTPELAESAAARVVAAAAPFAHNGYKVPLARELARRAILRAAGMAS